MNSLECSKVIESFFEKNGIDYKYSTKENVFYGRFSVEKTKTFRIVIGGNEREVMMFVSLEGIVADPGNMTELIKFANMINWKVKSGKLAIDPRDGEIRFDNYINVEAMETLPMEMLEKVVMLSISSMYRYYGGILSLALGFSDAETEMKKIEEQEITE